MVKTIRNAKEVSEHVPELHDMSKECLRALYLNSRHQIVYDEVVSLGTLDATLISPREVFLPALINGANGIILVHNHPSGEVTPSQADIDVTKQLIEAGKILGIALIDHVIVAHGKHASVPCDYE